MDAVGELEESLSLDQAQGLADYDSGEARGSSTQQLLDDLLGRFDEDESAMFLADGPKPEFYSDSDE